MEICIVAAFFYPYKGGIEAQLYEMIRRLYENKINVKILYLVPKEELTKIKEYPYAECIPVNVKRYFLPRASPPPFNFFFPYELMEKFEKKCSNIKIIHSFNELIGAIVYKKNKNNVFIHSQHNVLKNGSTFLPWRVASNLITDVIYKNYIKRCNKVVSISRHISEELKMYCDVKEENIKLIPNGLNLKKFVYSKKGAEEFRKEHEIDKFFIFSTGRMIKEKGFHQLIKAVAEMKNKDVILGLGGDGYYRNELMNLSKKLKLNTRFFGYLNRKELNNAFCACDIFVTPSLFQEPFGLVVIEGMAFKKPVVASRVGGIPDIINNDKIGMLYDSLDYMELSKKLSILYDDKNLRKKLGINGRKKVERKYNWDILIKEWIKFYKSLT